MDGSVTSRQILPVRFRSVYQRTLAVKVLRPPFVAIGMLSACVLSYEVLLTRLFSIVLWHHFAYMIISAAMLGYGASGTALTLLKDKISLNFSFAYVVAAIGVVFSDAFVISTGANRFLSIRSNCFGTKLS